jgi:hypothetical protein
LSPKSTIIKNINLQNFIFLSLYFQTKKELERGREREGEREGGREGERETEREIW